MLRDILRRIESEQSTEDNWIVGPKTGHLLYWLIRVVAPENVVEIGTSVGYSAIWLAAALDSNRKGKLWTIESHAERFEKARANIAEAELTQRVVQLKGHAPEIFFQEDSGLPDQIDFAFFDATKKNHGEFFEAVFPRMKSGGMIVVDNVISHRFGHMKDFLERTHADSRLKTVEIPVGDGLLIARVV